MKKFILIALSLVALTVHAEVLKNVEAVRLFTTLRNVQPGLSAVNTNRTALNINALRPAVEAFEQTQQKIAAKGQAIPVNDVDKTTKIQKLNDEFAAVSADTVTVDLKQVVLSDQEILDAKITPDALAQFLQFLGEPKPKK